MIKRAFGTFRIRFQGQSNLNFEKVHPKIRSDQFLMNFNRFLVQIRQKIHFITFFTVSHFFSFSFKLKKFLQIFCQNQNSKFSTRKFYCSNKNFSCFPNLFHFFQIFSVFPYFFSFSTSFFRDPFEF